MNPFLQQTAEDLYAKYGDDLASIAVVFPNNRARLFFSEFLYKAAGKPLWTPGFVTISNLFKEQSELIIADPLALVGYLYDIYLRESGKEESFDEFYLWGEILLSDFDDVDKNLANAQQLFRNIREQAAYTDTLEHLTEEQVASIRMFFKNFDPDRKTELKQRFIENWNILYEVYLGFQVTLEEKGLAYEGMLNRRVIEKIRDEGPSGFSFDKYAFVGFNVLNGCEIALFTLLQKAGKAFFYWDYDVFYLNSPRHEAGRFMRQNLEKFPNELGKAGFDTFGNTQKNIQFISASTENAQARFLPEWIKGLKGQLPENFRPEETAVVLCNEGLLLSVLHSVPDDIRELNVTMGFPMVQTPIFNLVNEITTLHADGYIKGAIGRYNHRYVLPILQHPLIRQMSGEAEALEQELRSKNSFRPSISELQKDHILTNIFTPAENPKDLANCLLVLFKQLAQFNAAPDEDDETQQLAAITGEYDPLNAEAVFRCYSLTNRLQTLLQDGVIEVNVHTFQKLLQKILSTASIPFSGEPVRGMQIMGMLETRNLDFKNILLLSVNEGMLPKGGGETSFIPYNLRKGFGLTTPEHKDSIFAYYFFRLLQRAENISLVYNTSTDGLNRGEMSRFMLQMLIESKHPVAHFSLNSSIELTSPRPIQIEKTQELMDGLKNNYVGENAKKFAPTALNSLIDCSLRFYFRYIAGLKEADEVSEEIDGAVLGNFFHNSAEFIYTSILLKKADESTTISDIEKAIKEKYINKSIESGKISGQILASDLESWLKGINQIEKVVDHFFRKDFFQIKNENAPLEYNGEQLIKRKLVIDFLKTLLKIDNERTPFNIVALEKEVSEDFELETLSGKVALKIGGFIDRIDMKHGEIRILDYKTGGKPKTPESVEALFDDSAERASYIFQIFLYSVILQKKNPETKIVPQILYIHKAAQEDYSPAINVGSFKSKKEVDSISEYEDVFREKLVETLKQLFDTELNFVQTSKQDKCTYCDYKRICRR